MNDFAKATLSVRVANEVALVATTNVDARQPRACWKRLRQQKSTRPLAFCAAGGASEVRTRRPTWDAKRIRMTDRRGSDRARWLASAAVESMFVGRSIELGASSNRAFATRYSPRVASRAHVRTTAHVPRGTPPVSAAATARPTTAPSSCCPRSHGGAEQSARCTTSCHWPRSRRSAAART